MLTMEATKQLWQLEGLEFCSNSYIAQSTWSGLKRVFIGSADCVCYQREHQIEKRTLRVSRTRLTKKPAITMDILESQEAVCVERGRTCQCIFALYSIEKC